MTGRQWSEERDDGTEERRIVATARDITADHNRSVILALPESALANALDEQLRQHGWTVLRATSSARARRLACRHLPDALVLSADSPDESGWLTCAKLVRAQPQLHVVLVGERSAFSVRFARFVGASALVPPTAGVEEVMARVAGAVPLVV
jgi:DNA-binding response OmpR family regulator